MIQKQYFLLPPFCNLNIGNFYFLPFVEKDPNLCSHVLFPLAVVFYLLAELPVNFFLEGPLHVRNLVLFIILFFLFIVGSVL